MCCGSTHCVPFHRGPSDSGAYNCLGSATRAREGIDGRLRAGSLSGSGAASLTRAALRTDGIGAATLARGVDLEDAAGGIIRCRDLAAFASGVGIGAVAGGLATAGGALSEAATEGVVLRDSRARLGSFGTTALSLFSEGCSGSTVVCTGGASVFPANSFEAECGVTGDVVVAVEALLGLAGAWFADAVGTFTMSFAARSCAASTGFTASCLRPGSTKRHPLTAS